MIVSHTKWTPDLTGTGRAKYKALAQAIREGIVSGQLSAGEQLPPVRELAFQIGVTPGTVARAYSVLTEERRLIAGVGRGTFVAGGRGAEPEVTTANPMRDTMVDFMQSAHLLSPKMPDVGQGDVIRDGLQHMAQTAPSDHLLRYPSRHTDLCAREAFVGAIKDAPIGTYELEDVICAHGGQSGIVMILQTILQGAHPVIAVDELSYGGFRSAAHLCRARVVGVPWDSDGPLPEALTHLIKTESVQVFCTSAEVCNPTTRTTTPQRRVEIAAIAQRYGVHIIDDDCYRLMRSNHIGPSYRTLLPDFGWYVASPSKSISAALRIGFVIAPNGWSQALIRTSTFHSFGVSRLITDLYAYVMAHPKLPQIVDDAKARIAQDVRGAVNVLGRHQIAWAEDVPFLWLSLPMGWRAGEFIQAAETVGVLIRSAEDFALRDGRAVHAIRIAVNGQMTHARFMEAMGVLRELLDHPPERLDV